MFSRGQIDKRTKDFLIPHHPWTAKLYLLPKIHKPGNLGRLIASSNWAPTENISRFVDCFLQPSVSTLPSLIRDTTDFISRLQRLPILPSGTLLMTLDVTSLYTNIPHDEGITTCKEFEPTRLVDIFNSWPLPSNLVNTCWAPSHLTRIITYKFKAQPWVPGWHHFMQTCSWESWSESSCGPKMLNLECVGGS